MSLNGSVHGCMASSRLSEVPTILYQEKVVEAWVGRFASQTFPGVTMGKLAKRNIISLGNRGGFHLGSII